MTDYVSREDHEDRVAQINAHRMDLQDRIEALTAENERLRGLFAALAIDPDACAVARQYARAALGDTQ